MAYAPGLGTIAGLGSAGQGGTSRDGLTWTARTVPARTWQAMAWSPARALFVAVASDVSGDTIYTSTDGVVWTARSTIAGGWQDVKWSDDLGLFVVVGTAAPNVMWSADGLTSTASTVPARAWSFLAYAPKLGKFVALDAASLRMIESTDGKAWTEKNTSFPGTLGNAEHTLTWSEDLGLFATINSFIASAKVCTSPDGVNWTVAASRGVSFQSGVVAGRGGFLAASDAGKKIYWSEDAITWQTVSAGVYPVTAAPMIWRGLWWARGADSPCRTRYTSHPSPA